MNRQTKKKIPVLSTVLSAVSLLLVVVFSVAWVITGNYTKIINQALGLKSTKIIKTAEDEEKEDLFKSDYEDVTDLKKADMEVAERLTEEGAVLLKNANNALPLKNDA